MHAKPSMLRSELIHSPLAEIVLRVESFDAEIILGSAADSIEDESSGLINLTVSGVN